MYHKNEDLRVQRTKEAIRNAFVELIEENGYEAITIKDITKRAKINRGTFYAHYQDKFELMETFKEKILSDLLTMVKVNLPNSIAEYKGNSSLKTPYVTAVTIFEYLNKNYKLFNVILNSSGNMAFQKELQKIIWRMLIENGPEALIDEDNLLVPADYLTSYVASAHLGIIQQWLGNGRKESPEEMAHILSVITVCGPFYAAGFKNESFEGKVDGV
ncbi:TetR/AcrR family transcriptional regulator C-terminal domain-containing protein [Neobacillus sp. YIM B02564]|uniref:TetR/AcrR family transcriptional regulator C-terminal domain-containing protein n=1 Tax=Neobacillus paridis TaxID=2803862 RepID=A0ABS1TQV4_9BACI|nr:TetR/AcrR family transcriptional regulator [Neobacillus paridis]MBL4953701.1 TetR/AcrR family transcriptional regulator C-terminal domain-containing protein [Neobacillus paridis]